MFAGILGQAKAVRLMSRALVSGRLAHAYLFCGPEGVGKATMARRVAQIVLCRAGIGDHSPCGICPGCSKFSSGNHPDFLHITPDGAAIKIDQIRDLKKALIYPPLEATRRVTLLEDVHTMRREAGNSLLKVLEEPPPDNLLLLVADDSEPLLPTIVSRCQVIPFYPLPLEAAADVLQRQQPELARQEALALAGLADGCPGRATGLDTQGVLALRGEVVDALFTTAPQEALRLETALVFADRAAALQERLESLLSLLLLFFKDALIAHFAHGGQRGGQCVLPAEIRQARERWNSAQLSDKIRAVEYARHTLGRNCNRTLVCEVLFLDLFQADAGR